MQIAATCNFADTNAELKSQLIAGCSAQHKTVRQTASINRIRGDPPKRKHQVYRQQQKQTSRPCFNCGGSWPHPGGQLQCPARGVTRKRCHKLNHFAKWCKSDRNTRPKPVPRPSQRREQRVNQLNSPGDDDYAYVVNAINSNVVLPHARVKVENVELDILIDTGASVDVVDEATFARFSPKPKLTRTNTRLVGYGSRRHIPHLGQFEATLETDSLIYVDTIHVVKGASGCLLRYATALQLGLVKVINHVDSEEIIKQYPALFDGSIGALKDYKVKLHIDTSVEPVAQPHRRIPFHVRKKVEDKLVELENADIIEKVDGPTPWISPIVTPPKPGNPDEIRLCVDMRGPNTAIKRERHITPTIEDVISDLNGARVFSKLDLNQGYHQIMLDESSRYITTFSTHVGLIRFKRLNFGICCASEIF